METVGKFEFNRKDLIGHGAFAVVFKGRHIEKHDCEVAIKCINKKNLVKSQTLLGKEIKILKELKHENIVALYDFQEMANSVYLVMEYCNGGDLADYLQYMSILGLLSCRDEAKLRLEEQHLIYHLGSLQPDVKGTLSEDTIRLFLQQIVGAMKVLHSKGVIHRDLKPQNILLSHIGGRKSNPNNIRIKIADFGFARYLQSNMLAATLCGSPMYMAPEVIMSQNYDAKADLWSIGTIVYQCLTGKAPFQANSPQNLRLFYEKNKALVPNIPRETSSHLCHLLLGLLLRNYKERMDFNDFFHHPFLDVSSSMKKSAPVPMPAYTGSASNSSCSSSSTSHLASPPSLTDVHLRMKSLASPPQEIPGFLQASRDSAGSSSKASSCDIDDFVLVPHNSPTHCSGELLTDSLTGRTVIDSLNYSSGSLLTSAGQGSHGEPFSPSASCSGSPSPSGQTRPNQELIATYGATVPIPVPTQVLNYQRIEQNLQSPKRSLPQRSEAFGRSCSTNPLGLNKTGASPPQYGDQGATHHRASSLGSFNLYPPSSQGVLPPEPHQHGLGSRLHSAPNLSDTLHYQQKMKKQYSEPLVAGMAQPLQSPPQQSCRQMKLSPKLSELIQRSPLPTIVGSPTKVSSPFEFPEAPSTQNLVTMLTHQGVTLASSRNRTAPDLGHFHHQQLGHAQKPADEEKGPFGRSLSAGKLSDLLLKAAFGGQATEAVSNENLSTERPMDVAAPGTAIGGHFPTASSCSPAPAIFMVGSPPSGASPHSGRTRMFSVGSSSSVSSLGSCSGWAPQSSPLGLAFEPEMPSALRYNFAEASATNAEAAITFEAPELPEETLMEEHTVILKNLRFTLTFVHCVMEIASARGNSLDTTAGSQLQDSVVVDQISLLSKEWSYAEQLVLSMKVAELLSTALHLSKGQIKEGRLYPSSSVKQVVKKLNEHYKSCVSLCRSLTARLQRFFLDKQQLMDRINSIAAEKLIYSHTVQLVQSTALDEMFQQGPDCIQRYQKALLLMEGLSQIISNDEDVRSINKCKQCIERRLSALHPRLCA
ncbi:serine/threonine-protein kinase ULK1 isoform X2 [Hypanus sabinus]|uniref:serine/threonine-protein kinase ULK1 isoform X2 n=1 Tax=Hypanus sabinus TaxID=79690 RepID=UPI0028C42C4F|nr:serine/threonine-protein kinase ULK1 isoform X2 [Hypanus sabinus]